MQEEDYYDEEDELEQDMIRRQTAPACSAEASEGAAGRRWPLKLAAANHMLADQLNP